MIKKRNKIMGKSVRPKQDPFAYTPEYNREIGSAAQAPGKTEQDPFSFKPEYNLEVKKKAGGDDLEAASPLPSEIPSSGNTNLQAPAATERIKPPSSADFLAKDVDASDFFGQLEAETQK